MSELRPEYQKIIDDLDSCDHDLVVAVKRCQSLADRPPRMLTDDEAREVWESVWSGRFDTERANNSVEVVSKIIARFIAKQSTLDTVPFDYEKWSAGGWDAITHTSDGKEVVCPVLGRGYEYTMRKIQP